MRAPISVVVPVLNAEKTLAGCAAALMEGVDAGLIREVVISDGGSTDMTQNIAEELGAVWVSGPATRGGQLLRGCSAARGDWLLVLHADTQLQKGWSSMVQAHLASGAPGYFKLRFDQGGVPSQVVAGWANLRSRLFGLPYGDQGLLVTRAEYLEVGGFLDIPLMEDVAIAGALRGRLKMLDACAITSAAKFQRAGWLRRGTRNLGTLLRYYCGASPEKLAERYRKP